MVEALTDDQANQARGDAATTNLTMLLAAAVRSATSGAQAGTRTDARCVPTISQLTLKMPPPLFSSISLHHVVLILIHCLQAMCNAVATGPSTCACRHSFFCPHCEHSLSMANRCQQASNTSVLLAPVFYSMPPPIGNYNLAATLLRSKDPTWRSALSVVTKLLCVCVGP